MFTHSEKNDLHWCLHIQRKYDVNYNNQNLRPKSESVGHNI